MHGLHFSDYNIIMGLLFTSTIFKESIFLNCLCFLTRLNNEHEYSYRLFALLTEH